MRLLRTLSAHRTPPPAPRRAPRRRGPRRGSGRAGPRGARANAHGNTGDPLWACAWQGCGAGEVSRLVSLRVRTLRRRTRAVGDGRAKTGAAVGVGPPCVAVLSRARALLRCTFGAFFKAVEAHHLESERIHHVQPMHPPAPPTHTHNSSAVAVQTARADAPRLKSDPRRLGHGPVPSPPYLHLHLHHLHHLRRQSSGGAPQNGSDQNGGVMYP